MAVAAGKKIEPSALMATFNHALKDSAPGSAQAASQESSTRLHSLHKIKQEIAGVRGQEAKPNDGGKSPLLGGAVGMLGRALFSSGVTAAATAIAGPAAGAAAGSVLALNDAGQLAASASRSALAEYEGKSDFKPVRSGREDPRRIEYDAAFYTDASGGSYVNGKPVTQQRMQVLTALNPFDGAADKKQEKAQAQLSGTVDKWIDDHQRQISTATAFDPTITAAVAKGPKPPAGGPGFVSMPGMA